MDVSCEALSLIHCIYKSLVRDNPEVAKQFEHNILVGLEACFMSDEEIKQHIDEMDRRNKRFANLLMELNNFINEFSKKTPEESAEDIRAADFKSDEDFMNWLHDKYGSDEEEES